MPQQHTRLVLDHATMQPTRTIAVAVAVGVHSGKIKPTFDDSDESCFKFFQIVPSFYYSSHKFT